MEETGDSTTEVNYVNTQLELFLLINRCRQIPQILVEMLDKIIPRFEGLIYRPRSSLENYITQEGVLVVYEAIERFKNQTPLKPLKFSKGLFLAAKVHCNDIGEKGIASHCGSDGLTLSQRIDSFGRWKNLIAENIAFNDSHPEDILLNFVLDDGNLKRGHRENLFNEKLSYVGIACGPHLEHKHCSVVNFSSEMFELDGTEIESPEYDFLASRIQQYGSPGFVNQQTLDDLSESEHLQSGGPTLASDVPGFKNAQSHRENPKDSSNNDDLYELEANFKVDGAKLLFSNDGFRQPQEASAGQDQGLLRMETEIIDLGPPKPFEMKVQSRISEEIQKDKDRIGFTRVKMAPELDEEDEERVQAERSHMKKSLRQRLKRNREIRQDLSMFESAENLTRKLEKMKRNVDKYLREEIPDEMKRKARKEMEEVKARAMIPEERMDARISDRDSRMDRIKRAEELLRKKKEDQKRRLKEQKERQAREAREQKEKAERDEQERILREQRLRDEREEEERRLRQIREQEEMERRQRIEREHRERMDREAREAREKRERVEFERIRHVEIEKELERVRKERERVEFLKNEIEEQRLNFKKEMDEEKRQRDRIEREELERLRKLKEKLEKNEKERQKKMIELQQQLREDAEKLRQQRELRDQMLQIEEQAVIQSERISIENEEEVMVETAKASLPKPRTKGQIPGHAEADELTTIEYENRRIFKRVNKQLRMQQRKKLDKIKFDRSRAKKLNFAAAQPLFGDEPRNLRPLAMFDIDKEMQKVEDGKIKMREQERLMSRKFGEFFLNRKEEARGLVALDRLGAPLDKMPRKHCNDQKKFINKKIEMKAKSLNAWGRPKFTQKGSAVKPKISENSPVVVHIHNNAGGDSHLPTHSEEIYERIELEKEAGIAAPLNINDLPGFKDESVKEEVEQSEPKQVQELKIDVSAKPNELMKKNQKHTTAKKKAKIYQPMKYKRSRSKGSKHKANADRLLPGNRMQSFIERNSKAKRERDKSRSRSRKRNVGEIKSLKKPKIGGIYGIDKNQLVSQKKRVRERSLSQKSGKANSRKEFDPRRLATISQGKRRRDQKNDRERRSRSRNKSRNRETIYDRIEREKERRGKIGGIKSVFQQVLKGQNSRNLKSEFDNRSLRSFDSISDNFHRSLKRRHNRRRSGREKSLKSRQASEYRRGSRSISGRRKKAKERLTKQPNNTNAMNNYKPPLGIDMKQVAKKEVKKETLFDDNKQKVFITETYHMLDGKKIIKKHTEETIF